jgi:hypothetical protein
MYNVENIADSSRPLWRGQKSLMKLVTMKIKFVTNPGGAAGLICLVDSRTKFNLLLGFQDQG